MNTLIKLLRLEWWVYIILSISFFASALILNYVVKRVNENRLEERFNRVRPKAHNSRTSQIQRRRVSRALARAPLEVVLEQSNPSTVYGISLIYNKEQNTNNEDKIDIKNFPQSKPIAAEVSILSDTDDLTSKQSENEIVVPMLLGKIYNEINVVARSKSLSNADKNDIIDIANRSEHKKQESKSTSSVKKVLDTQNTTIVEFETWSLKLAGENFNATTSSDINKDEHEPI